MPCRSEVGEVVHSLTLIDVVVVVIKSGLSKRCSRVGDGEMKSSISFALMVSMGYQHLG